MQTSSDFFVIDPSVLSRDNKYGFPQKFNKRYKISYALSHSKIKERYKACKWKYDKREGKRIIFMPHVAILI